MPNEALLPSLASSNSQIITGRDGTGKTHLLLNLEHHLRSRGITCAFVDLQTVGSASDLYSISPGIADHSIRATRIAVDTLAALHDALRIRFLDTDTMDEVSARHLDELATAITDVRVAGEEERSRKVETERYEKGMGGQAINRGSQSGTSLSGSRDHGGGDTSSTLIVETGHADVWLQLGSVRRSFEGLSRHREGDREGLFVLLDEWDSVPPVLQPWLADLIRRLLWDTSGCIVKIAASSAPRFEKTLPDGWLGLTPSRNATVDLDATRASPLGADNQSFLLSVLHEHAKHAMRRVASPEDAGADLEAFTKIAFADSVAAETLVEAAEKNPRDALTIAERAAQMAGLGRIKASDVAAAGHWLAIAHKLRHIEIGQGLERWLTDRVLAPGQSRSFFVPLLNQELPPPLEAMYENRLLHPDNRTELGLDRDPHQEFAEWHVDFGYALQLMRTHTPAISSIEVPPASGFDDPAAAPVYDEQAVLRLSQAPPPPRALPTNPAGLPRVWVESAIEALPLRGDFLILDQHGSFETLQLVESPTILGRSLTKSTFQIAEETVSGRHAELLKGVGGWRIVDCDSTNGTTLNGKNISAADLKSFDVIGLGTASILYVRRG